MTQPKKVPLKWKSKEQIEQEKAEQEYLAKLPSEIEQLRAQVKANADYNELLEEVIVEMAQFVYAGD